MSKKRNKPFILFRNKSVVLIQAFATIFTLFAVIRLNLLATKYLLVAIAVLILLLLVYSALILKTREQSGPNLFAKILSMLLSLALLLGTVYVVRGDSFLRSITGAESEDHEISIVALASSPYESIDDVRDFDFGANTTMDKKNVDEAVAMLLQNEDLDVTLDEYTQYKTLVEDLEDGTLEVIILNEGHRDLVSDIDENFDEDTKVIHTIKYKTKVVKNDLNTNVTGETFSFFITGIDTYGSVSSVSRSDVNMIMTVNPKENQILLLSIPRDYHVRLASSGVYDKLTHAGIYGVNESVSTLENLLDIDIDYYIRVNFSSVEDIVDSMGGVEAYSMYNFNAQGYSYSEGMNYMDGPKALAFVRERYTLPNGDLDRGRHQQELMEGIINKATSPAILTRYNSILGSVSGSLEMSMPDGDLKKLVKAQQDGGKSWDIQQYQLTGYGDSSTNTYSMPGWNLYVMEPDYSTVERASSLIHQMENNEVISVD